jgi:hypothetical protein
MFLLFQVRDRLSSTGQFNLNCAVRLVLQTVVTNFAAATLMPLQTVSQIMVCGIFYFPLIFVV